MADDQNQSVGSSEATTTTTSTPKPKDPDPMLEDNPDLKKHQQKQQKERGEE